MCWGLEEDETDDAGVEKRRGLACDGTWKRCGLKEEEEMCIATWNRREDHGFDQFSLRGTPGASRSKWIGAVTKCNLL